TGAAAGWRRASRSTTGCRGGRRRTARRRPTAIPASPWESSSASGRGSLVPEAHVMLAPFVLASALAAGPAAASASAPAADDYRWEGPLIVAASLLDSA